MFRMNGVKPGSACVWIRIRKMGVEKTNLEGEISFDRILDY